MRFPKELCSQRSTQSDIDMLSSWCLSLRTSWVVDGPELRSWFFPLLLLSNFSLSPRNDLLLLFLVQTPIFLSQVRRKLSWKHLLWSSLEITCLKSGQLRFSWLSWIWWSWRRSQGELRFVIWKFDWKIGENILAVEWSLSTTLVFMPLIDIESILYWSISGNTKAQSRCPTTLSNAQLRN